MRATALATVLLLAGCVHRVALPFDEARVRLHVTLTIGKSGPIGVRLQLPAELWRGSATPDFAQLPPSYGAQLHPYPKLESAPGQPLDVSYSVDIADLRKPLEDVAILEGSFDTPSGRHLALNTLVPQLGLENHRAVDTLPAVVEIRSEVPFVTSLDGSGSTYWALTAEELHLGVIVVGATQEATSEDGVRFVSLDFDHDALARLASLEHRASISLESSHGGRQPLKMFVVHSKPVPTPKVFTAGINRGPIAAMFSDGAPDGRSTSMSGNIMLHELIHSYQPPDEALPHWITEGFTEYFAHRLAISLEGLPDAVLYEDLTDLWAAFVENAPGRRASETRVGDYFGGAVLAYCIDVRLRRDHSTLEQVLAATRKRAHGDVANDLWEQTIAVASASAGALVLSARTDPIDPVEQCFKEDGLRRAASRLAVSPGYAGHALGISAVDAQPRHEDVIVLRVTPGSFVEVGDAIVAVDGNRVTSAAAMFERLYDILRAGGPANVGFEVSRGGKPLLLHRQLPALSAPRDTQATSRNAWERKP